MPEPAWKSSKRVEVGVVHKQGGGVASDGEQSYLVYSHVSSSEIAGSMITEMVKINVGW
jgi:hypothetical protein